MTANRPYQTIKIPKIGWRFYVQCLIWYRAPLYGGGCWEAHEYAYKQLRDKHGTERTARWRRAIKCALDSIERQVREEAREVR